MKISKAKKILSDNGITWNNYFDNIKESSNNRFLRNVKVHKN